MTYREIVYMVLDLLKNNSDDAYYNEDHILAMLDNYRAYILKSKYGNQGADEVPDNAYSEVTMMLEPCESVPGFQEPNYYLRSTEPLPEDLGIGFTKIYGTDYFKGEITLVDKERFRYVGNNRYLFNIIYATVGPADYLYLRSSNPQFKYLGKVTYRAILESPSEALKSGKDEEFDIMDEEFPMEASLIGLLVDYVYRVMIGATYHPSDTVNNAHDDLEQQVVRGVNYGKTDKSPFDSK